MRSAPAIRTYRFYIYEAINPNIDRITTLPAGRLASAGHQAYPVQASRTLDGERPRGIFSHKLAAHLAGLGHIGKACLLVTERFGARVRFGTVLTDAPLETGTPLEGSCGECSRCVEICPVHAFTGVEFHPEDPREVRYNAHPSSRYLDHREKTLGARACGLCVLARDGR